MILLWQKQKKRKNTDASKTFDNCPCVHKHMQLGIFSCLYVLNCNLLLIIKILCI